LEEFIAPFEALFQNLTPLCEEISHSLIYLWPLYNHLGLDQHSLFI